MNISRFAVSRSTAFNLRLDCGTMLVKPATSVTDATGRHGTTVTADVPVSLPSSALTVTPMLPPTTPVTLA
jgi:hypothetical protein